MMMWLVYHIRPWIEGNVRTGKDSLMYVGPGLSKSGELPFCSMSGMLQGHTQLSLLYRNGLWGGYFFRLVE